jgi:hypothetical protein
MATTTKPKPDVLYVCVQSFASNDFAVAAGDRHRGDNPIVARVSDRFVPADTPDDEVRQRRAALEAPPPPPEPIGRVKLRVLPGIGSEGSHWAGDQQTVSVGGRTYYPDQTLEAEGADAQHLLDSGTVEIVKSLPKKLAEAGEAIATGRQAA